MLRARASDGSFDHLVNLTAFAIFALRAAGSSAGLPGPRSRRSWLERQQNPDGGFGFAGRGGGEDVDDTAAALQALVDAGAQRGSALVAARWPTCAAPRTPTAAFPSSPAANPTPSRPRGRSRAWIAAGVRPWALSDAPAAARRLATCESLVAPDGSVRYSRTSAQTPVWVTAQALTALAGKPFPVAPASVTAKHAHPRVECRRSLTALPAPSCSRVHALRGMSAPPARRAELPRCGSALLLAGLCVVGLALTWVLAALVPATHAQATRSRCTTSRASTARSWKRPANALLDLLDTAVLHRCGDSCSWLSRSRRASRGSRSRWRWCWCSRRSAPSCSSRCSPTPTLRSARRTSSAPRGRAATRPRSRLVWCALLVAPTRCVGGRRGRRRGVRRGRRLLAADPRLAHAKRRARRLPARHAVGRAGARWLCCAGVGAVVRSLSGGASGRPRGIERSRRAHRGSHSGSGCLRFALRARRG